MKLEVTTLSSQGHAFADGSLPLRCVCSCPLLRELIALRADRGRLCLREPPSAHRPCTRLDRSRVWVVGRLPVADRLLVAGRTHPLAPTTVRWHLRAPRSLAAIQGSSGSVRAVVPLVVVALTNRAASADSAVIQAMVLIEAGSVAAGALQSTTPVGIVHSKAAGAVLQV